MEKRRIKIAHVVTRLVFGGVEAVIYNICTAIDQDQFDFHIITQDINDEKNIKQFENAGFTIHIIPHKRKGLLNNLLCMYRVLKKERFDIIHTHMTLTNVFALMPALLCGVKTRISHSHNALKPSLKNHVMVFINKLFTTDYFACGAEAGEFLFGKSAVNRGKVTILNNAINVDKFGYLPTVRRNIRNELGLNDNNFCIGHVGRFMKQKNHKFLVEIFEQVYHINENVRLLLVGNGELYEEICQLIADKKLDKVVICTGNISNVNEMYQAMDLFLLPSLFEGLPVSLVEAQCAGLPCFVSDRVDKTVAFSERLRFLPIDSISIWSDEIERFIEKSEVIQSREFGVQEVIDSNYSITKEAEKLSDYYSMRVQEV